MSGIVCIGGAALDLSLRLEGPTVLGTSNLASAASGFGGVARNVAELLTRFGVPTALLAAVGDDAEGRGVLDHLRTAGVDVARCVLVDGAETARYVAIIDGAGELVLGVNAMAVTAEITPERIANADLGDAEWMFAECNLDAAALEAVRRKRIAGTAKLAIDTISVPKVARLPSDLSAIDLLFTNVDEANALLGLSATKDREGGLSLASALLDRGIGAAVVTLGEQGHVVRTADGAWWSAAVTASAIDVTGAGDALIAGTLAGIHRGLSLPEATRAGALAAALTTESPTVAPPDLTLERLERSRDRLDATPMEGPLP